MNTAKKTVAPLSNRWVTLKRRQDHTFLCQNANLGKIYTPDSMRCINVKDFSAGLCAVSMFLRILLDDKNVIFITVFPSRMR